MKKSRGLSVLALLALVLAAPPLAAVGFGMDLRIHGDAVGTDGGNGNSFVAGAQARLHLFWIIGAEAGPRTTPTAPISAASAASKSRMFRSRSPRSSAGGCRSTATSSTSSSTRAASTT